MNFETKSKGSMKIFSSIVESHHKDNELTTIINYKRDEQWNQSYEAYNFNINGYVFKSRLAKKTTKKKDIFIALGKR